MPFISDPFNRPVATDLTAAVIENATVRLHDLFWANFDGQNMVMRNKTLRDCSIQGPALLMPIHQCRFDACDFGDSLGDNRNLLYRPLSETHVVGAIVMSNCIFERCNFFAVGYSGDESFIKTVIDIPYARTAKP